MTKLEKLIDEYPDGEFLKVEGFDDCILGIAERQNGLLVLAYDKEKIIKKLLKMGCNDLEEAEEYFDFNIIGAWVGEKTPVFISKNF